MVYNFFDKKSTASSVAAITSEVTPNQQVADELHKPIIRKFQKRQAMSSFTDNIWRTDLADMQLISKYNRGVWFSFCVIDVFDKYARDVLLKDKIGKTITKAFQEVVKNPNLKPNKITVDKSCEFDNRSLKPWIKYNK